MTENGSAQKMALWKAILISLAIIVVALGYMMGTSYLGLNDPWIAFLALTVWGATGMKMEQAPGIFLGGAVGLLISYGVVALPEMYGDLAIIIPLAAIILSISFVIVGRFKLIFNFGMFTFMTIGSAGFVNENMFHLSYLRDLAFGALCFWILPWALTSFMRKTPAKKSDN